MIKIIPAYNIGIKVIKFKFSLIVRTFEIQNGENLDILFDLVKWKTPESWILHEFQGLCETD